MTSPVAELVAELAALVATLRPPYVPRVAIDGPDAAGKTMLADELARALTGIRPAIRAGVDGFHHPRAVRRRRGEESAEGYYEDAFDYEAVRSRLLDPLGPGGDRRYRTAAFDHRTDAPTAAEWRTAADDAVLLFDGVFLLRPVLRDRWDLTILVEITPDETLRRALVRDGDLFGGPANVRRRYRRRYLPAQELYRAEAAPAARADIVIDNNDPYRPRVRRWPR